MTPKKNPKQKGNVQNAEPVSADKILKMDSAQTVSEKDTPQPPPREVTIEDLAQLMMSQQKRIDAMEDLVKTYINTQNKQRREDQKAAQKWLNKADPNDYIKPMQKKSQTPMDAMKGMGGIMDLIGGLMGGGDTQKTSLESQITTKLTGKVINLVEKQVEKLITGNDKKDKLIDLLIKKLANSEIGFEP